MNIHQAQVHPEYIEGCFMCRIGSVQTSTGDANSMKTMASKKWDGELQAYRNARAEGIQPAGTTTAHIEAAKKASDLMGNAYNANTMVNAKKLGKKTANVMKELKEAGIQ